MKKFTFYNFIILIFTLFVSSNLSSKDFPPGITLIKEGTGYKVNLDLPPYYTTPIVAGGDNYLNLTVNDYGITPEIGYPCLPSVSFNLFTSESEQRPVAKDISIATELKTLATKLYPTQAPWEKTFNLQDRPFTINRAYYQTKGETKPFVVISEPFNIGGVKGYRVTIFPFSYNPVDNQLTIINKGSFKIDLSFNPETRVSHSTSFNHFLSTVFVNYEPVPISMTPTNNYLIITAPEFQSTLTAFTTQKTGLGYNVFVANTTQTGTTTAAIKAYIQQRYDNMTTRPEFILLVGDVDKIPEWVGGGEGSPHTDLNYALLEGNDLFPDAFLGRFSVSSTTELSNIITKSIFMENNINSLPKKSIFMASNDNYSVSEGTHNFVIDSFFMPSSYTFQKLYVHTYNATTIQLIDALNANQSFAIYSGHGAETSWADGPPLNQSQVSALTNSVYPYVYSFSCLTGRFEYPVCFGETWIRSATGGSLYWGSTVTSYWDEDDILEKRLFRAMFIDHLIKTAPMFVQAKIYFVNYFGTITPTVQRYLEMYNLLGDPSLYEATYGPAITHTPLPNTENMSGPYPVNCTIVPAGSPIDPAKTRLFWTRTTAFDSLLLTNTSGNNWTANIPGNGNPALYKYFIKTADMMNRVVTSPGGAPSNYYSFLAMSDTSKPVIVHTAIGNTPKNQWPVAVNALVTDMIGIDSVWVRWYKNNVSTGIKHFKLNNTGGNNFSGLFNSDTSQVAYNDIIYYKLFGRDNSSAHNCDSTSLYNFTLIAVANACIGNGSTAVSYPYNTYWHDSKTDMLYTSAEIIAGGGTAGMITRIGFNVVSAASQTMNGFNIKMQNTTMTSLTGFVQSGWTTVYSGTYTVPGTGWQYVDLQTPFAYTGTQNLLVEICFDNTSYTSATTVNATSVSGMTWTQYQDNSAGCGFTAGSSQASRPNLCMTISLLVANQNIQSNIPKVYSLEQNYPNPFNPSTSIKYSIPKQSMVKLVIYDIIGREVATLVNEVKTAGNYSVAFDGTNLASGVYFYRIEAGTFTNVKKMILVK